MISVFVVSRKLVRAIRSGFADPSFRGTRQLAAVLILAGTVFSFSVTTLATVGHGDFTPETRMGSAFTVFYVLMILGVGLSAVTQIAGHATKRTSTD